MYPTLSTKNVERMGHGRFVGGSDRYSMNPAPPAVTKEGVMLKMAGGAALMVRAAVDGLSAAGGIDCNAGCSGGSNHACRNRDRHLRAEPAEFSPFIWHCCQSRARSPFPPSLLNAYNQPVVHTFTSSRCGRGGRLGGRGLGLGRFLSVCAGAQTG